MSEPLEQIKGFYQEAFQTSGKSAPQIEVRFYPYIGINHTIRQREGRIFVRLAELSRDLPLAAQRALAFILVAKLLRKPVSPKALQTYRESIKGVELRERVAANKRARGRKIITTATGDFYDLHEIFRHLNQTYFDGKIPPPTLSWSAKKTFRILGHHDAAHETIVVSRSLDGARVPKYVVEFVVFHEMLHIFHPTIYREGRRYNHTPAFRRDERKFAYFDEAENWIERNVKNLKRSARKIVKSEK
jgi:hypothetical protein